MIAEIKKNRIVIAHLSSFDEAPRVQDEAVILVQMPSLPDLHVSKKKVSAVSTISFHH